MGFAAQNPDYPVSVHGRWFELIKAASAPVIPVVPTIPLKNSITNEIKLIIKFV